jgi:thioredoxin reductase
VRTGDLESREMTEIAIIGAGPYGLSIAAHLAESDISFRIFGRLMSSWSEHMPKGMQLKSEGFACSLFDPKGEFTLKNYCAWEGIAYKDLGLPVKLETFVAYGLAFQKKFVPNLEQMFVTHVERVQQGFRLVLENQDEVFAKRVIVATGITNFACIPEILQGLPAEFVSHSWDQSDLDRFRRRRVAVIGAGASALDIATLLHEGGAHVELIARSSAIHFHAPPPKKISLKSRLRHPITPMGPGLDLFFFSNVPGLFRFLPESVRLDLVRTTLGPAPGWFIKNRIDGRIPYHLGVEIAAASAEDGRIKLELTKDAAHFKVIEVDHVIAATGYRVDLDRLSILSTETRQRIQLTGGSPALSANFESSVPGLYFVGLAAANVFGPFLRFACGAGFAARRLAKHFERRTPEVGLVPASQDAKRYSPDVREEESLNVDT